MNTKNSLLAAALVGASLVASAAFAAPSAETGAMITPTFSPDTNITRAAVKAETRYAVAHGLIERGQVQPFLSDAAPSTLNRADVKAATRQAVALNLIPKGEEPFVAPEEAARSTAVRADVKAETRYAVSHNLIQRGESNVIGQ